MTTCRPIKGSKYNLVFEYLGEFETELKNTLGYESGVLESEPRCVRLMEKPEVENLVLLSLSVKFF
jgi:hypothetical protein